MNLVIGVVLSLPILVAAGLIVWALFFFPDQNRRRK